ncbi:DUF1629 domain-containing protein [Paenibacillus sp. FSL K6-1318]|uniref:imm11 family protein n=1 Tax=Paenibacillus sp. FSL K6-1318 TaxID=2975291 RepID=UPI0030EF545E
MKIYRLSGHPKSMDINLEDSEHLLNSDFNGNPLREDWEPAKVVTVHKRLYQDFPDFTLGKLIVTDEVKEIMASSLQTQVEFLKLIHDSLDLYVVNVINILDCVDWQRTDVMYTSKGRFSRFNTIFFDLSKIPSGTSIFKLKETASHQIYVTHEFKKSVEQYKFKGLDFTMVFDSDFDKDQEDRQKQEYENMLVEIERNKGEEYTYVDARELVDRGEAMASGQWKMQLNRQGQFLLGELLKDVSYQWMIPAYIPPVLLLKSWHKVKKSEI